MSNMAAKSTPGRRERTGGIVRDKLDLLMDTVSAERVPQHLLDAAEQLQAALDAKAPKTS